MDLQIYFRAILALIFVLGLIGLISFILKKYSLDKQFLKKGSSKKRLSIEEMHPIDTKRRLVLIKRDNVEHLILLGVNSETLIENNINDTNKQVGK